MVCSPDTDTHEYHYLPSQDAGGVQARPSTPAAAVSPTCAPAPAVGAAAGVNPSPTHGREGVGAGAPH